MKTAQVALILLIFLLPLTARAQSKENCLNEKLLDECAGEVVILKGPQNEEAFPLWVPGLTDKNEKKDHQIAIQVADTSVVLISEKLISCEGNITAQGKLSIIDRKCVEGTKCRERQYYVHIDYWECDDR